MLSKSDIKVAITCALQELRYNPLSMHLVMNLADYYSDTVLVIEQRGGLCECSPLVMHVRCMSRKEFDSFRVETMNSFWVIDKETGACATHTQI